MKKMDKILDKIPDIIFPKMLFWYIKLERELEKFPFLNKYSISVKRRRRNETPEQKAAYSKKMSLIMSPIMKKIMPEVRKRYIKNIVIFSRY